MSPTYARGPAFARDFVKLTDQQQRCFLAAVAAMVADLKACDAFASQLALAIRFVLGLVSRTVRRDQDPMFRFVRMREHWCGPDLCDQDVHHLLGKTHGQDQGGHVAIEGEQYLVAARGGRCPCYSGRRVVPVRRDCSGTVELSAAPEQLCCRVRDTGCSPHRSGQRRLDRLGGETVPSADVRRAAARRGLAGRFVVGSRAGVVIGPGSAGRRRGW